eukprot:TRINITY_DN7209_c1_g1_i1.p1 TRINITY_DN7209_c1_g1~~TRINITY_DN7209_c1_g1_i1.p1  ORF type:complete len:262 (+),score=25.59 TRINITY_DN7209_c1_g1_i1:106-891(+)
MYSRDKSIKLTPMSSWASEDAFLLGGDASKNDLKSAAVSIRKGFVRKVYGILTIQLVVTVLVAAQIVDAASNKQWILDHKWLLFLSIGMTFGTMCAMICCQEACRTFPTNYIFLFVFTFFEAVMIGFVSAMFTPQSVLLAAGVTVLIFLALTLYALFTPTDFTGMGPYLFAGLMALLIFGFILLLLPLFGVPIEVTTAVYDCLAVVLFSFFIIFDTQLMLGEFGGHSVKISIDEYVFAALNLYMDIINLFIHLLSLFGERR